MSMENPQELEYFRCLARQTQVQKIKDQITALHDQFTATHATDEFTLLAMNTAVNWPFLYEQAGVTKEVFFARAIQRVEEDVQFNHAEILMHEVGEATSPDVRWEREIALSNPPFIPDIYRNEIRYIFKGYDQQVQQALETGKQQGVQLVVSHVARSDVPLRVNIPFGMAQTEHIELTPTYDQRGRVGYMPTKVEGIDLKYAWASMKPATLPRLSFRVRPL